jgi:hypothetical protein
MIELKDPIKISKVGKKMSPPILVVIRIIILFWLKDGNLLMFHSAQKFSS